MVVRLENGNTHVINSLNDIKEIIEPSIAEAIDEIVIAEYDTLDIDDLTEDIESLEGEIKSLQDEIEELKAELRNKDNEKWESENKVNTARWQIRELVNDYGKSKSKRVDKETVILKLEKTMKRLEDEK